MKRFISVTVCLLLVMNIAGCASDKKEEEKHPAAESEEVVSEPRTIAGHITEVSSHRFKMTSDSGVIYEFDCRDMETDMEMLRADVRMQVTYVEKAGVRLAHSAIVLQEDMQAEQPTVDTIITHMSVEEKVGQMFFVRCPDEHAVQDVERYHLGGYILFDKDFKNQTPDTVRKTIASYQEKAAIPLLVGVDEEGGDVNRLSRYTAFRAVPFWSSQKLYAQGGFDLIRLDVKDKAQLLKSLGINVNLAPVADVSTDEDDFIYSRSFGKDALQSAAYVREVITSMKENGIGSTMKHFPGYGNNVDTHTGLSVDSRPLEQFEQSDFLPFIAGIEAGADSILVSHNIVNSMDKKHPASLSLKVHEILRNELGFQGVIMTDDLYMDAIKKYYDEDVAAAAALKAGNDLLICSNYRTQIPAVIQAVKNGEISEQQLDDSLRRILKWKAQLGLIDIT